MTTAFSSLLAFHLTCAFLAIALFWVAAAALKGGRPHRRAGAWFSRAVYVTAATGAAMAVAGLLAPDWSHPLATVDPAARQAGRQTMWLVLYVLLIVVAPVQHGLAVVAASTQPARVRSRTHAALNIASMVGSLALLSATVIWQRWIFLIVMPVGFIVGLRNMAYASLQTATPRAQRQEHLTSLVTAGITLHTALFVFGTSRTLGWEMTGLTQLWPWTLPALVGLPAIVYLRTRRV